MSPQVKILEHIPRTLPIYSIYFCQVVIIDVNTLTSQVFSTEDVYMGCRMDSYCHDDVIKWKHYPRYWPLCGELSGDR